MKRIDALRRFLRKVLISLRHFMGYLLLVVVTWLFQVTFMPYLSNSLLPTINLCFCTTAVVTVCYGKSRAYCTGAIYGILYEAMLPSLPMMNLLFYPVAALVCSVFFADRSEQRLSEMRATNPNARNDRPYLRTVCCAAMNVLLYEAVNIAYIYLGGTIPTLSHYANAVLNILLTSAVTLPLALAERRFLGFPDTAAPTNQPGYYVSADSR